MLKTVHCLALISICLSSFYLLVFYSKEYRIKAEEKLNTPKAGIFKVISITKRGMLTYVSVHGVGCRRNQDSIWHFWPWEISGCEDCADTIIIEIDHSQYKAPYKAILEKHHSSVYS